MKKQDSKTGHLNLSAVIFFFCLSLFIIHSSLFTAAAHAKIYIDITSPSGKRLPIAVQELSGNEGKIIADIISADLDFTGLFQNLDRASFIEASGRPFNPANWSMIGAEAVVKGSVTGDQNLSVAILLYDVFEGKEALKKEYKGEKAAIRQIAHSVSSDIYKYITGESGIFATKVAFVAEDEGKKGLYVMDWDGSKIRRLGIKGNFVLTPHWSKDGAKLVYSSERGGQWGIYLLDFTKMTERKVFAAPGLNMTGNFSPDGEEIMFSSTKDESYGLYRLNLSNSGISRITSTRWIDVSPAVSPDGKSVAFVSDRGGTPQIYIMNKNGYDVRRLTFEGNYNTSPSWSPDGKKIAYVGRYAGKHQIHVIDHDGANLTRLTESGNNEDPSFSPDGRYIIFSSDRERVNGIYIMRSNGEAQKRITPAWLRAFGPKWSPN